MRLAEEKQTPSRNLGVEVLRVLCVLYIIGFWHLLGYTDAVQGYNNIVTSTVTDIVLATFVFISGYFASLRPMELSARGVIRFYSTKLLRIYPLYLAAIFSFVLFGLTSIPNASKASIFLSMILKPAPQTLWFITMIMLFFFVTPLVLAAVQKIELKKLLLLFGIVIVVLLGYYYATKLLDIRLVLYLPAYFASVLLATGKITFPKPEIKHFAIFIALVLISLIQFSAGSLTILFNAPLVTFSAILFFTLFSSFTLTSNTVAKIITFISYSSFCMYLFHRPLLIMLKVFYFPTSGTLQVLYLVLFCLPLVVIFSYDIQKVFDLFRSYVIERKPASINN